MLRHVDGPLAGRPAVTRRAAGGGAWYVSAMLDQTTLQRIVDGSSRSGRSADGHRASRPGGGASRPRRRFRGLFLINHRDGRRHGRRVRHGPARRLRAGPGDRRARGRRPRAARGGDRMTVVERDLARAGQPSGACTCCVAAASGWWWRRVRDGLPDVLHWGRDTGPVSATDAGDLVAAQGRAVSPSAYDAAWPLTLLPTEHDGWEGRPGIAGQVGGRPLVPVWHEVAVRGNGQRARRRRGVRRAGAVDRPVLDAHGVLRVRQSVTNTAPRTSSSARWRPCCRSVTGLRGARPGREVDARADAPAAGADRRGATCARVVAAARGTTPRR